MIASGNSVDLVAMILGALLMVCGPYCATYLLFRKLVWHHGHFERSMTPTKLLLFSIGMGYVWFLGTSVAWAVVHAITCGFASFLMLFVGPVLCIVVTFKHFKRRFGERTQGLEYPPPKYQIWLQDIMVAAFAVGLTLTMITNFRFLIKSKAVFVTIIICEIATQIVMFLVILDAARYSTRLSQSKARMGYVFGMLLVNAFFPIPLLPAVAWNAWRRAMALADEPKVPLL